MSASTAENATERVVVLMTPTQKADASRRAKAARLSLGDFIRRQTFGDDEMLTAVVAQLRESTASATGALDHALAQLVDAQASQAKRDAQARDRARAEFSNIDPEAFAALLDATPAATRATQVRELVR